MLDSESDVEFEHIGDYCDVDGQEALRPCLVNSCVHRVKLSVIELLQDGPPLDASERDSILLDMDDGKPTTNQ